MTDKTDEIIIEEKIEVIDEQKKEKKWDHLPVRPSTFAELRRLKSIKESKSDDAFVLELLKVYKEKIEEKSEEMKEEIGVKNE